MNHSYRLVWNGARQCPVAAPETASRRGTSRAAKALAPAAALLGAALALPTWAQAPPALPQGGQLLAGQARIEQNGHQMTIQQDSQKAILQWQGFDIGAGASVRFRQPDASSVALNRVVAGNASQIHGQLDANGQVWLVNPNGVVFGAGSRVNVGALIASVLDTGDADFLAGKAQFQRGSAARGGIVNQGEITALGNGQGEGLVALLAPTVRNDGIVRARLGNVALAAGDRITLQAGADGLLQVAVDPSTVRTLIENQQLIMADGGQVLMTGRAADALSASVVANTGTVQARSVANRDGRVLLLADMQHGEVRAAGTLQAHFVETSGAAMDIAPQLQVRTDGGHWLIDPVDITIDKDQARAIQTAIETGDVTVTTSSNGSAGGTDKGDIHVNADIAYAKNQLTLNADNSIFVNAKLSVNGDGKLALNHGGTAGDGARQAAAGSQLQVHGQVDFAKAGTGLLAINGHDYTVINSLEGLQNMGDSLGGKYALGKWINAQSSALAGDGQGFAPIGNTQAGFTGVFDGLGHSIYGLTIQRPLASHVGLFGYTDNATLRNVQLVEAIMAGGGNVGTIAGETMRSTVYNVSASGRVSASSALTLSIGGLIGRNTVGHIANAHATGDVSALLDPSIPSGETSFHAGGLIGSNFLGRISNSYATGNVDGSIGLANLIFDTDMFAYAGGLIGYNFGGNVSNAYATGNASAGVRPDSKLDKYMSAAITVHSGGLIGANHGSEIGNAYATGNVFAKLPQHTTPEGYLKITAYSGGLIGADDGGRMFQTYAAGVASPTATLRFSHYRLDAFSGGLVGTGTSEIRNSFYATTDAQGQTINTGGRAAQAGAAGKTFDQLRQQSTFAGWDIDDQGGTGLTWRIYEGQTTPLLRSLLKPLTVSGGSITGPNYNGAIISGTTEYTTDVSGAALQGTLRYETNSRNAGDYRFDDGTLQLGGLYSGQQGYDIRYADTSLTVGKAMLTLSAVTDHKTYDGSTASGETVRHGDLMKGDSITRLSQSFDSRNAGDRMLQVNSGYTIEDGNGGNNYAVETVAAEGSIDTRALTITARNTQKQLGQTLVFSGAEFLTGAGLVAGEKVTHVALASAGAAANAEVGEYSIAAGEARGTGGFDGANYSIHYVAGLLSVKSADTPPVIPPVTPPVSPPVTPPVTPPVAPPVTPPVAPPVTPPVAPPVTPPVAPPVTPPVMPPVAPPVIPPVAPPAIAPSQPPEKPPVDAPVSSPEAPSVKPPFTSLAMLSAGQLSVDTVQPWAGSHGAGGQKPADGLPSTDGQLSADGSHCAGQAALHRLTPGDACGWDAGPAPVLTVAPDFIRLQ